MRSLLQHEGWMVFVRYVAANHGPQGYRSRMQQALAERDPAKRSDAVMRVEVGADLADALVSWPTRRLLKLEREPLEPSPQRGGYV